MNTPLHPLLPRIVLASAAALLAALPSLHADDYTWTLPGAGAWNTDALNWNDGVTNPTAWINGNTAIFTGTGGYTVTVASGISASSLQLTTTSGTINFSGSPIDVPSISTGAASIDMFAKLTGSHGLTYTSTGGGRLNLKVASDYTGDTFLTGSAYMLTDTVSNALSIGTTLNMVSGTTFRFAKDNINQEIAGLAGAGTFYTTNAGNTATINTKSGTTTAYSGTVSGGLSLVIKGSGTQSLTGTNSYSGTTTVSDGTLSLGKNLTATSSVTVDGGVLTSSVVNVDLGIGAVSMSSGEMSANGADAAGTFTLAANQLFSATGGKLTFNIGTALDQIKGSGTGTFNIGSGTELSLILGSGFDYNSTYTLFSGFASGSVAATGVTITGYDTANWLASLSNTGVLSFAVSSVPEPSTCALLAGTVILGLVVVRRRQRFISN